MKFKPAGPPRFEHQKRALKRIIETRGVTGLLMAPGVGKTAVVLDYLSLLALKAYEGDDREVRALVISPKAAVENWVLQAEKYLHPDVNVWAEALGGSILQKSYTLSNRGPGARRPRKMDRKRDAKQVPLRALNHDRAELIYARPPEALPGTLTGPRLILLSTNYDAFSSRAQRGSRTMADVMVQAVDRFKPDVLILDESHKIKSNSSNVSRLMGRIGRLVPRRLILTGTVAPHSPMDIYAQWRFLEPTAFGYYNPAQGRKGYATWSGFQQRFGVFGGFMGRQVVSYQNLDEMQDIMADNAIVVKKEDALDLPAMTISEVPFSLSPREQAEYDSMAIVLNRKFKEEDRKKLIEGQPVPANRLVQMMRLRQLTAGHLPDDDGVVEGVGSSKIDVIDSLANDTLVGENRIVVFALFRYEIDMLKKTLARKGTEVLVIDGSTSDKERLAIRQRFGSDDPARLILVAQVKTISLSVNELVTANHAIFASLSQQRDDQIQAQDRLHRIGQKKPVTIWIPLAKGTVDGVIWNSRQKRTDLESALLDHVQQIGEMKYTNRRS